MVEAMFSELEDCEQSGEHVTDSKIAELRAAFGLDGESTAPTEASPIETAPIETSPKASPSPSIKAEPEFTIEEDFADEEAQVLELDDEEELYEEMETSSTMDELELVNDESVQYEIDEETMELANEEEVSLHKDPANVIEEFSYVFKCHVCGEVFDQMCFLANHARNVHHVHPKVACSCGRMLSTWESLMAHKRKHEPLENNFTCEICDATFRKKTGLSIHIKFKHEKPATIHECEICSRQFKERSVLKAHVRTHLPDSEKYTSECKTCFKRFVNKWSLKYHISTIHDRKSAGQRLSWDFEFQIFFQAFRIISASFAEEGSETKATCGLTSSPTQPRTSHVSYTNVSALIDSILSSFLRRHLRRPIQEQNQPSKPQKDSQSD